MHAIELPAKISPQHELYLKLPEDTDTGPARVIILFDSPAPRLERPGNLDGFLSRLPRNPSESLTHDEIQRRIEAEQVEWDVLPRALTTFKSAKARRVVAENKI